MTRGRALALEVTCHESETTLTPELLDAWRGLADATGMPYMLPEFVLASWHGYRAPMDGTLLRILVARDAGGVVAVAPFVAHGPGRFGRSGWGTPGIGQRHGPIAAPGRELEAAAAFAVWLAGEGRPNPSDLLLWASDADSVWGRGLRDAWPGRLRPQLRRLNPTPAPIARLHDGYEGWFGSRSSSLRQGLRRRIKMMTKRGGEVRRVTDRAAAAPALEALFALHHERFALLGKPSSLTGGHRDAIREAVGQLLPTGRARLLTCVHDEEVVGAQLFFHAGERVCFWNGGTSSAWARESLGLVLLDAALRDAAELGATVFDLGGGDQDYKLRLSDADAPLITEQLIVCDRRWPLVHADQAPDHARRLARAALQRMPEAWEQRARHLRGRLHR